MALSARKMAQLSHFFDDLSKVRFREPGKAVFFCRNSDCMPTSGTHIPGAVALSGKKELQTLVENRRVYSLDSCELNIFETYQTAEKVPLKFNDLVITSMLRGKKRMHHPGRPEFDYLPGESLLWQANEWMVIDFPEATTTNPTQCVALTISNEEIQETIQYLNRRMPRTEESGEWQLSREEFYLLNSDDLAEAISRIIKVSTDGSRMKDVFAELALRELLLKLMQTQARQLVETHCRKMASYSRFAAVIQHIKENIYRKIVVEDLCKLACMSRPSFFRQFRREFGITPVEYILKERILLAKELLADPGMSVSTACYQSGFNSINYFIRTFREFESCTPLKYKMKVNRSA
jgi:AraC family transcriptional regulator